MLQRFGGWKNLEYNIINYIGFTSLAIEIKNLELSAYEHLFRFNYSYFKTIYELNIRNRFLNTLYIKQFKVR
jgi:hypothetical protein